LPRLQPHLPEFRQLARFGFGIQRIPPGLSTGPATPEVVIIVC
jgi:hypothetical protein